MRLLQATMSISAVQGLIGTLLGVAAIISGLSIPPERELVFRAFVISVMFVVTVFLLTHKDAIGGMDTKTKFKYTIFTVYASGISLLLYLNAFEFVVIFDTLTTEKKLMI